MKSLITALFDDVDDVDDVEIVDTVGAGDSFTAAFVVAYLRGDTLAEAQRLASATASYVCSRKGAMPE